jgi:hypothetical protein
VGGVCANMPLKVATTGSQVSAPNSLFYGKLGISSISFDWLHFISLRPYRAPRYTMGKNGLFDCSFLVLLRKDRRRAP